MAEHTPGPWKAKHDHAGSAVVNGDDARIAWCGHNLPPNGSLAVKCYDTIEANARLIAAAPDMLEALECIEAGSGYAQLTDGKLNKIRTAIAKARGRA